MMAINVRRRILDDIITTLKGAEFEEIKVYNELGLLLAEG